MTCNVIISTLECRHLQFFLVFSYTGSKLHFGNQKSELGKKTAVAAPIIKDSEQKDAHNRVNNNSFNN